MKKIFIVEVYYDYECHVIGGVFDNEEEARKLADFFENENGVLDGVYIKEEVIFSTMEQWDEYYDTDE